MGSERLAAELDRRKLGVRTLARMVAGPNGNVEKERRMIYRALSDGISNENARRIALALDLPDETFVDSPAERQRSVAGLRRRLEAIETDREQRGAQLATTLETLEARQRDFDERLAKLENALQVRPSAPSKGQG